MNHLYKLLLSMSLGSAFVFATTAPKIEWGDFTVKGTTALQGATSTQLDVDNIRLDGNTISTTNSNGDLTFDMNGTGRVIFADLTATTVPYLDANKKLTSSSVTPTELGYVSGVTSALQTQLGTKATYTANNHGVLLSGLSTTATVIGPDASTAKTLISGGLSADPTWGTLGVAGGGTGQTSYTDGQLLIGNTSTGLLSKATLTQGSNITITNGNGTITIASSGAAAAAYSPTAQSTGYTAAANDYVVMSGASSNFTLPTAVGANGKSIWLEHGGTSLSQIYTVLTTSSEVVIGPSGSLSSGTFGAQTQGEVYRFISDNVRWRIAEHKTATTWSSDVTIPWSATGAYVFSWTGSKNIILGDKYTDGSGNTYIVSASTNTTSGTFSEVGTATPATTGTLTVVSPGTSASPISWTSRTITGQPIIGTSATNRQIWKRIGDEVEIYFEYGTTGVGTAGTGNYIQLFPTGIFMDTTQISSLTTVAVAQNALLKGTSEVGRATGYYGAGPTDIIDWRIFPYSNSGVRLSGYASASGGTLDGGSNWAFGNASTNVFGRMRFKVVDSTGNKWQP